MTTLRTLAQITAAWPDTAPMPVLFVGHGNPMYAIQANPYAPVWQRLGTSIARPTAILCVSAHWESWGVQVTGQLHPRTIHDFGGFPPELYSVQYPAPGSPTLAEAARSVLQPVEVAEDQRWGFDHGNWAVMRHIYPKADIPMVQLSLDRGRTPQAHVELARQLAPLRRKGVLIVGSGNTVHNLREVSFGMTTGYDWAIEANNTFNELIRKNDLKALAGYATLGRAAQLAVPTPEHYLPLLYALALRGAGEPIEFFNNVVEYGSLAMTGVRVG